MGFVVNKEYVSLNYSFEPWKLRKSMQRIREKQTNKPIPRPKIIESLQIVLKI